MQGENQPQPGTQAQQEQPEQPQQQPLQEASQVPQQVTYSPPRPASPTRKTPEKREALSPKSSQSRQGRSPTVPIQKKLGTVRFMLSKEEQKHNNSLNQIQPLREEKRALEEELQAQQQSQSSVKSENSALTNELANLRHQNNELNSKISSLLQAKNQQPQGQKESLLKQINAAKNELERKHNYHQQIKSQKEGDLVRIQHQTTTQEQNLHRLEQELELKLTRKRIIAETITRLQGYKTQTQTEIEKTKSQERHHLQEADKKRAELTNKIQQARERIQQQKQALKASKYQQDTQPNNSQGSSDDYNEAIKNRDALTANIKSVEQQIQQKTTENNRQKEDHKKHQKRINDLKRKTQQNVKKRHELNQELANLEASLEQKKPIKFEEKVPEQLQAARSKNESLRRQIKKLNQKIELEQAEMEKLVPPAVIENMNKKISTIISNNQRSSEISKIVADVSKENKELAAQRESLEWGQNNYLKDLENQRKKQEEKNKALQDQLLLKKKSIQQVSAKLEQYVQSYPHFKPEKKKKPETEKNIKNEKSKKATSSALAEEGDRSPTHETKNKKNVVEHVSRTSSAVAVEQPGEEGKKGKKKKKQPDNESIKQEYKSQKESPDVRQLQKKPSKEEVRAPEPGKKKNKKK